MFEHSATLEEEIISEVALLYLTSSQIKLVLYSIFSKELSVHTGYGIGIRLSQAACSKKAGVN